MQTSMAIWYAVWILVPMVPAIVLFKVIPSDASASGPLFGLRWKLGGAFAGYAFVLLASYYLFIAGITKHIFEQQDADLARTEQELGEPWTITGQIHKVDGTVPNETKFMTQPQFFDVRDDTGFFSVKVLLPRRKATDVLPPDLVITCDHYVQQTVSLQWENAPKPQFAIGEAKYTATRDPATHKITISPAIVLEPEPTAEYKP
jgi:hypothetical protein